MVDEFITKPNNSNFQVRERRAFSGFTKKPNEKRLLIISFMSLIEMFWSQAMVIKL